MAIALENKKVLQILGVNSGTSADGIDLALVSVNPFADKFKLKYLSGKSYNFPPAMRTEIIKAADNRLSIDELILLDRKLGYFIGKKSLQFLEFEKRRVDLIASHGQTIRHLPGRVSLGGHKESATLQIGHAETICAVTKKTVAFDFRQADISAGGEGAPITTYAMYKLFHTPKENRLLINIGGISNYFLFPKKGGAKKIMARDCGPGNALIDLAAYHLFGKKYDRNGALAGKGTVSQRLLTLMMADNFLKGKYGPSTGKERFGEKYFGKVLKSAKKLNLSDHDIIASLTALTSRVIFQSIKPIILKDSISAAYIFGGGVHNKMLMHHLRQALGEVRLETVDTLGYDPDFIEAACYAVMGSDMVNKIKTGLPSVTSARYPVTQGRIVFP